MAQRRTWLGCPRYPRGPPIGPHAQLGDQHCACVVQTLHHRSVLGGHAVPEWLSAVRGWDARGIHEVLGAPRDAMQWPTVLARPDFLVSLPGLRERELARERDYATQF